MILFLRNILKYSKILLALASIIAVGLVIYIFGKPYFQKKSFETKIDTNRTERDIYRETENCNSKKQICKLYDKKSKEECEDVFNKCIQTIKEEQQ